MASGSNDSTATSPEEKAIKTCYKNLVLCIKASLSDTLVELTPHDLISPEQRRYISNPTHDEAVRATKIVDCILDKLAECTTQDGRRKIYEQFTGSLVCAETVKRQLQEALEKERLQQQKRPLDAKDDQNSLEETAIRSSRDKLAPCIQQTPEDTVAKLTLHGLSSQELRQYMEDPIHGQGTKAQEIVDYMLEKIAQCKTSHERAEVFRQFTASLSDPNEVIKIEDKIDEWEVSYERILRERGELCKDVESDSEFRRLNELKSKLKQHRERVRRIITKIENISGRASRDKEDIQQQLDEVDNELQLLQIKKEIEEIDRKFTQSMKCFKQKEKEWQRTNETVEKIKKEEAEYHQSVHGQQLDFEKELHQISCEVEAQHQLSEKLIGHFYKLQQHTEVLDDVKKFTGILTEHREAFQKVEDKLKSIQSTKTEDKIKYCEEKSEECEKMLQQCQQVKNECNHCLKVTKTRLNECQKHLNTCTHKLNLLEQRVNHFSKVHLFPLHQIRSLKLKSSISIVKTTINNYLEELKRHITVINNL